jgi:3-oxoacyl-[acyl-carrier protein] reductase
MIDLTGKTALVTGGSRGIGRATCLLLARAGAQIIFSYRADHPAADSLAESLKLLGRRAVSVSGDIARADTIDRIFETGIKTFGKIDIVVGNAGIWKKGPIDSLAESEWHETIDTNLKSIFLTCQRSVKEMKPRREGAIVLVSSTAGQRGEAFHSTYAASKGAIIALTKSLASELGPWNIRVNAIAPGWTDTDMCASVFSDRKQREEIERLSPLGRVASAEDIGGAILFLVSDLARHVHGEVLNVNGGAVLCG